MGARLLGVSGFVELLRTFWERLLRLPLTMMIASLLAGLGIVQMTFLLGNGFYRYFTWNHQVQQVSAQRDQLQKDVDVLQAVKSKADDPEYMTGLARCLGYVGSDERVLVATSAAQSSQSGETPAGNCETVRLP